MPEQFKKNTYIKLYIDEDGKLVTDVQGDPHDLLSLLVTSMQYPQIMEIMVMAVAIREEASQEELERIGNYFHES